MSTALHLDKCDERTIALVNRYIERLSLPVDDLWVTTSRATFARWLGRRVPAAYGGAYCYLRQSGRHAVLINVERIDLEQPHALEIVIAEELIHMRDWLDGDHRRHSHHGHDRIAYRVAALVGVSMDDVRSALLPVQRRPLRYLYRCPGCGAEAKRRRRGTWSCGRCSPKFDRRFVLRLVAELPNAPD